ncbi:phospholipase A(1) [Enterobacter cloacae]|uniref:phospholipase A(1) n=1 Tax=Enterobacter cloacae TaxID=550 RepID=UPI00058920FB|nr:phospholipase A(1) [Enterobacter cloacae]EMC9753217.1 phospholipase [Enterobacter cloacae]KIF97871.1 phospholipase A1 [Enterobacter cloacae]HBL4972114.1 phospholipase [Enterobacter cloacae]HDC4290983.1 phospholipase [Enterobacter cloacae]
MYNIKFVYLFSENVSPALFAKIIRPSVAGQWIMSVPDNSLRSLFTRYDLLHSITGANPYQSGRDTRKLIVQDLDMGRVVAIDESYRNWSSVTEIFYINADGRLQAASLDGLGWYPVSTIVDRYETMVRTYGSRPAPTVLPKQVVKSKAAQMPDEPTPGKDGKTYAAQLENMTKAERWQARKDLIAKGSNSLYPDAQIAAKRLAANNIAVEKAKLAENVYKTVNPLEATPGVPEGWKDISNDAGALKKYGLDKEVLFDHADTPDFLARVYQPDSAVFGNDMNPTIVFRGSRQPEFFPTKNMADWINNGAQGLGMESDYYKRAVRLGSRLAKSASKIDIAGHSLGGGLASATSIASGQAGWTFNAAGLHSTTVEKYGGSLLGEADNIQAYRVEGELLTKIQEVNLAEDYKMLKGHIPTLIAKEEISAIMPNAAGVVHDLPGGTGGPLDRHGIGQAIDCIEQQKDEDISIIRSRA